MSVFEEPEWWPLIDRDAAIAEQFPPLEVVKKERPGGPLALRLNAEHEQRKEKRLVRDRRRRLQEADAASLIARVEARTSEDEKRRRISELERERQEIEREIRHAERRLSHLNATANYIERKTA